MSDADNKTPPQEVSEFRMGQAQEHTPSSGQASVKTRLIRHAGGYGGFQAKYGRSPFATTKEEAKKLLGRNQKCFCGSGKKYKKCCLINR